MHATSAGEFPMTPASRTVVVVGPALAADAGGACTGAVVR